MVIMRYYIQLSAPGVSDHQRSKQGKETTKKDKCIVKTSTQTLQQLQYSLFYGKVLLKQFKQFSNVIFILQSLLS